MTLENTLIVMLIILGFGLSLYAWHCMTVAEQQKIKNTKLVQHCTTMNALVIREFNEMLSQGKFPTEQQQDRWVQLTGGCKEP